VVHYVTKPLAPDTLLEDSSRFVLLGGQSISRGAEGCRFSIYLYFEHQPNHLGHLTARGLLDECIFRRPLFLRRDDLLEASFHHSLARPISGRQRDFLFWITVHPTRP
jgi:hypothetical protein